MIASQATETYDVVIIGGGIAGASTALLLRRENPSLRVLIVERSVEFERKVGEATVEVSGFFLAHVLRMHKQLTHEHLPKHGLRYYFSDGQGRRLETMTEVGATSSPSIPSFQLDRARLDQTALELAEAEGADVLRPARVGPVEHGWPTSQVQIEAEAERRVAARWIVDASGRHACLARRMGILEKNTEHPTAAMWGHWSGTLDLDGTASQGEAPGDRRLPLVFASRQLATNHFCGRGWWAWVIPQRGGDTSIGIVWDTRIFELPEAETSRGRYEAFVRSQDGLREVVAGATLQDDEFRLRRHLSYRPQRYMDRGWALVGDAAAFLDPYYSPGLDHMAMSVFATTRIIGDDLAGKLDDAPLQSAIELHNTRFRRSFDNWFDALYRDKYELFGDAELTAAAFCMDTAMYYVGVVGPVYRDLAELGIPTLGREGWKTVLPAKIMRFTNRRLVSLARKRQKRGTYGRRNADWRMLVQDFGSGRRTLTPAHRRGLRLWLGAELHNLAGYFRRARQAEPLPAVGQPAPPQKA